MKKKLEKKKGYLHKTNKRGECRKKNKSGDNKECNKESSKICNENYETEIHE